ncbi:class I SAM-dependent methyltransferase [Aeromicrobium sp. CTD01-1L150]|uniref:class I SAM-dependent methyltransferase n=1 Tax=Aeromicrobium sp. CTD01-1L150 TaxID=3341830 RepID=UPI0035BF7246
MDADARQRTAATWDGGDYAKLARRLADAAETVAAAAGPCDGAAAIDVAAGTGSLAIELARAGWRTSAVDIAPTLVTQGRERTRDLGLQIDWHEGTLDELPVADASQALVGSSFGLIFAPDPQAALAEARRVLAPDGRIVISTWPHDGYMATMTETIAAFFPPGAPTDLPFRWGDLSRLHGWLAEHFTDVETTTHPLPWQFDNVEAAVEFLFTHSPGHVAAAKAASEWAQEMKQAVADHLAELNGGHGVVDMSVDYQVTIATAR